MLKLFKNNFILYVTTALVT